MRLAFALMVSIVVFAPAMAQAQPSESEKRADALFKEGRALLDGGDAVAACPKFEESQRLDPGLGTLLNLADCYERTDRMASALTAFRSAEEQARAIGEKKREVAAADRARALETKVSRVSITLASGDRPSGFEVRKNGSVVPAVDFGRPLMVDPGTVTIEALAPGYQAFRIELPIASTRTQQQVDVPMLVPAPAIDPVDHTHDHHDVTPPIPGPATPLITIEDPGAGRRRTAYIVGGVGLAGLGAGVAVGFIAKSKYKDAGCGNDHVCDDAQALKDANAARRLGTIGTVVGGVGLAAVVTGAVLWFTAPKAHSVEVQPTLSTTGAGVTFIGRF
jgi:hypothetical protein